MMLERIDELSQSLAGRVMEMKTNRLQSLTAAKESLQRCEEKVVAGDAPALEPSTDPCAKERKLLVDVEKRGKSLLPFLAGNTMGKSLKQMAEIRADYPICDKKPE